MEETDIVYHLLLTMLEILSKEALILSFIKNRLLDEKFKRKGSCKPTKSETSHSAAFMSSPNDNKKNKTGDTGHKQKFAYKCYNCDIPGVQV